MSRRFSEQDHDRFAQIVDMILPAAHGMPSGNEVGVADQGLDAVLKLRSDLAGELLRGIRLFGDDGDLDRLKSDLDAWHAVRLCAYAGYYNAPEVQGVLGYAGQTSQPFDPDAVPDYLLDGSLQQVIDRARTI